MIDFTKGILEPHLWRGKRFFIKRDDLISPQINGNKAYKFYSLLERNFSHIVSAGGNQSNAMATLAILARYKGAKFTYITPPLSKYLQNNISGNLKIALENGVKLVFCKDYKNELAKFENTDECVVVPQGGACELAKCGLEILAKNLLQSAATHKLDNIAVLYSSGTGTSSLYLKYFLIKFAADFGVKNIEVFTTPCCGDKSYLTRQFENLIPNHLFHPQILTTREKIAFGTPNAALLGIYNEWREIGVEFDLLYDCVLWLAAAENLPLGSHSQDSNNFDYKADIKSSLEPKLSQNLQSNTANARILRDKILDSSEKLESSLRESKASEAIYNAESKSVESKIIDYHDSANTESRNDKNAKSLSKAAINKNQQSKNNLQSYQNLIFIHSGGLSGNETQLLRYAHKKLL